MCVIIYSLSSLPEQKVVFPGAGYDGVTEYKSVIYYQVKQPCWNETVKVRRPRPPGVAPPTLPTLHLFLLLPPTSPPLPKGDHPH